MKLVFLFALLPAFILADLPVHCLSTDLVGDWDFTVDQVLFPVDLKDKRVSCGNGFPNQSNNTAVLTLNDGKKLEGVWTMIYDQGFELRVPGYQFMTFFMYLEGIKVGTMAESQQAHTRSVCGRTIQGWYKIGKDKMSCFFGIKRGGKANAVRVSYSPKIERIKKGYLHGAALIQAASANWKQFKSPPKYTQSQLKEAFILTKKFEQMVIDAKSANDLPDKFDWRNINGVNFLSPVRNQGRCGSCYAISLIESLEARLRVKEKDITRPLLSAEFVLRCGIYTQGCKGGYAYSGGRFIRDFGVPTEKELPYKPASRQECHEILKTSMKMMKVKDYGYVGGDYGGTSEEAMIRELVRYGPFVVGLNPGRKLKTYDGGILRNDPVSLAEDVNSATIRDQNKQWEEVEHAVLLVGYGTSKEGTKYWILQNSWGQKFGNQGFFFVERGVDALNIESLAVFLRL